MYVLFSCFVYVFSILCILCFRIVSPSVYSFLFPNFVQDYRSLPPAGNPVAVNTVHIIQNKGSFQVTRCQHQSMIELVI